MPFKGTKDKRSAPEASSLRTPAADGRAKLESLGEACFSEKEEHREDARPRPSGELWMAEDEGVKCVWAFNALVACPLPANQFASYYRFGDFDLCGDKFRDLKLCLWAKLQSDKEKRAEVLSQASYMQENKTSESILRRKETPGW
eukprot:scaffold5020_cov258-Pinguiococcus_pyrenoidosus.AAC.4